MRTSLIILGVLLLVVGGIFYFIPTQSASATTTTGTVGSTDTRVSSASITVPWPITVGILIAGFVFTLFGLILPGANDPADPNTTRSTYDSTTRETTTGRGRTKRVTRERHTKRKRTQ